MTYCYCIPLSPLAITNGLKTPLFFPDEIVERVVTNGPDPEITDIEILRVFALSSDAAFIASEIADELDVTTEGARHQMNNLVERGLLRKKKPGQRTVLYWITNSGVDYYADNSDSGSR